MIVAKSPTKSRSISSRVVRQSDRPNAHPGAKKSSPIGVLGSPKDLAEHQRAVTIGTGAGQKRTIKTLDILYLLRSKMGAFRQRESQSDRTDILHILGTYEGEARAIRGKLDREAVEFFVESIPEEDRSFFKTLLGI